MRHRDRAGFTLVELLVVIAIVALLVSIVIPAVRGAIHASRVAGCVNNLRRLASAHQLYQSDHRGLFADVGLPHGGLGFVEQSFVTTLKPYDDHVLALRSPLDNSPHWALQDGGQGVPVPNSNGAFRRTSYGMNNYLSRTFSPAAAIDPAAASDRLARVPAPSQTVCFLLMAEEGEYAGSDHPHVEEWWAPGAGPGLPPVQAATQVSTAAAGGKPSTGDARSNWSFVDGHVETLRFGNTYIDDQANGFDPAVASTFIQRVTGSQ
ncbi:MAG: type II secretion system protein [Phycisphaerales bacterium]|nr:type II secretion system protein [Phycisphaerales bacterium]